MTQTVLERMTAGVTKEAGAIMARKGAAAGPLLTPVQNEALQTVAEVAGLIPKDIPGTLLAREGLVLMSKDLRRYIAELTAIADGLDVMTGVPAAVEADTAKKAATNAKLAEKEADRRAKDRVDAADGSAPAAKRVAEQEAFDAKLAAQTAAAQAATFVASDAPAGDEGWVCPKHADKSLVTLTATKSKRKYLACTVGDCEEFEPKPEVAS